MSNLMNTGDEFSFSKREIRQINRNMKKNMADDVVIDSDEEEVVSMPPPQQPVYNNPVYFYNEEFEYSTKENTRRMKRSHEKKPKKLPKEVIDRDTESNDEDDENVIYKIKKDNSRRARKENITFKPKNEKRVSFEQEKKVKDFRVPMGRYMKDKKEIAVDDIRVSKRVRNEKLNNYYESENRTIESDDDDEEYIDEE